MQGRLQQTYRYAQEIGRNATFSGSLELSRLARLGSLVLPEQARISVSFEFTRSAFQHAAVTGHIDASLSLECQRCMEPMAQNIELDFELLIDASDEDIKTLQMDSVYSVEGYLDMYEVIEDEIILSLPLVAMHADESCNPYWQSDSVEDQVVEKNNPFAVLESLKGQD